MRMVQDRDKADTARRWRFVFAITRTWKTVEEKTLKNLVTHLPRQYYQRTQVPRETAGKGRRTFWTYHTRVCLRHVGDVTLVLSKKGRNVGPHNTKLLVTNLAELTPRQVVSIYQKRWAVELLNWELKSGLGLGEHQVSGDTNRSEKSVGIAVLAYLFVLRVCPHEIVPGKPWSIFQLQHALRLRVMTNQVEHRVKIKMGKIHKAAYSFALGLYGVDSEYISQARRAEDVVRGYGMLAQVLRDFTEALVIPFDAAAAVVFERLVAQRVRVGTMDLRIAAIALSHEMVLVTRNASDFRRVPGLRIEDWTV